MPELSGAVQAVALHAALGVERAMEVRADAHLHDRRKARCFQGRETDGVHGAQASEFTEHAVAPAVSMVVEGHRAVRDRSAKDGAHVAGGNPFTCTGCEDSSGSSDPIPSWPTVLSPQH